MPAPNPHPNAYWVHDRLIASEYPGTKVRETTDAAAKIDALLDAGVRCFVDLTHPHELVPYEALLMEVAARRGEEVVYHRRPIHDVSVPTPAEMRATLDLLDAEIAAGRVVCVHCWGGIGRTATVAGCHLVRRGGHTGDKALAHIAERWRTVEKYPRARRSPETEEQETFVRTWAELR